MQTNHPTRIKIPILIGKNRVRSNSTGPMVDDDFGEDNLGKLRLVLREEARTAGVEGDLTTWVANSVKTILDMYGEAHKEWIANPKNTCGHVYEMSLPSGKALLLADRKFLAII